MLIRYKTELESVRDDQIRFQHSVSFVTVRNSTVTIIVCYTLEPCFCNIFFICSQTQLHFYSKVIDLEKNLPWNIGTILHIMKKSAKIVRVVFVPVL
jgi:hypothetical protein